MTKALLAAVLAGAAFAMPVAAQETPKDHTLFELMDVFQLEWATDPQVSPDGKTIAYVRRGYDIRSDSPRSNIWTIDVASGAHRPLLSGTTNYSSPRWSPDGTRLAYVTGADKGAQIYVRWMRDGQTARVTDLIEGPGSLSWSPDGREIAFTMFEKADAKPIAQLPAPPEGADWNTRPKVIDQTFYRGDGAGYYEQGLTHLFVVSAEGGTPRQLTRDDYDYGSAISWSKDGRTLFIATDQTEDWREGQGNADIFAVDARSGAKRRVTETGASEFVPKVSPDGRRLAYFLRSDRKSWHVPSEVWTSNLDGSDARRVAAGLDRTIDGFEWAADSRSLYLMHDEGGSSRLVKATLNGGYQTVAEDLGGESIGRPYSGASLSVAADAGTVAYTGGDVHSPADIHVLGRRGSRQLTQLNADLDAITRWGEVRDLDVMTWYGSRTQCWMVTPPDFDETQKYPMILEIHGGPHSNYGRHFSAEVQLMAAEGYVVTYCNPRGSTGYGDEFAMAIDDAYPSVDYDDLMAGVDAAIATGLVDPDRLFVTGGSGGGVLTAWIVGKTDRFKAAVVAKPVINWTTFMLTADFGVGAWDELFQAKPWEDPTRYWEQSPLSLAGNVKTPTMLLTGEQDYRTPMSETEQFYGALRMQGVPSAMVRIQNASHGIAARPSNLMAKVAYILGWFDRYDPANSGEDAERIMAVN